MRGGGASTSYDSADKEYHYHKPRRRWNKKRLWIMAGIAAVVLLIVVVVAVVVSKKNAGGGGDAKSSNLSGISPSSIPPGSPAWLDPFQWKDTADFNLTFTSQTVGDLPLIGLFSSWE